jgi:hypothetical protein
LDALRWRYSARDAAAARPWPEAECQQLAVWVARLQQLTL